MAEAFAAVRAQAVKALTRGAQDQSGFLRKLDSRQRQVLALFQSQATATSAEIARCLGIGQRPAADLAKRWITDGFLIVQDPARKSRSYRLGEEYDAIAARTNLQVTPFMWLN